MIANRWWGFSSSGNGSVPTNSHTSSCCSRELSSSSSDWVSGRRSTGLSCARRAGRRKGAASASRGTDPGECSGSASRPPAAPWRQRRSGLSEWVWLPVAASLRILTLRTHAARFGSLRQHAFGEIESLLRLGQLLPQLEHVGLERLDRLERVNRVGPRLDLAPTGTLTQPAGPPREPEREHYVDRGMRQLGLPDGEPGTDQVDDGQYRGDPEPRSGLEGHDAILVNDSL